MKTKATEFLSEKIYKTQTHTHTQMRAYKYKMTREYLEMSSSERANEHNMTEC